MSTNVADFSDTGGPTLRYFSDAVAGTRHTGPGYLISTPRRTDYLDLVALSETEAEVLALLILRDVRERRRTSP